MVALDWGSCATDRMRITMTTEPPLTNAPCHMVLTRFNVQTSITGGRDVISRAWLEPRIELFERFCLPSMQAQSPGYEWLVWFDARTPDDLRRRIEAHTGYTAIWVDGPHDTLRAVRDIAARTPAHATHLITTRLDNDDALADRYLQAVRTALGHKVDAFVNFPFGYQWRDGRLYFFVHRSNQFLSYVEPLDRAQENLGIRSVWNGNHDWARHAGRLTQVWTRPMWLQVLHGGNVANELLGVRRSLGSPPAGFPDLGLVEESWVQRNCDVPRSISHILALPWRRREAVLRRLRRAG
jgi:hypothetical protein